MNDEQLAKLENLAYEFTNTTRLIVEDMNAATAAAAAEMTRAAQQMQSAATNMREAAGMMAMARR